MTLTFEKEGLEVQDYTDDTHPLAIFLKGDSETREDILLGHPDVIGFIYVHDGEVVKTFLPKKVINFNATAPENKKVIAAITGDTADFTPLSIPISEIFKDDLHLSDCKSLNKDTPAVSIAKYVKDNLNDLPKLPKGLSSAAKIKNLQSVAFPYILPIVKGLYLSEGDLNDPNVFKNISDAHDIYADWAFLHAHKHIITSEFSVNESSCPFPQEAINGLATYKELPAKLLFKNKNDSTSPYNILKKEVEKFKLQNKEDISAKNEQSIPNIVNLNDDAKTVASASTSSSAVNPMNERLAVFIKFFFQVPVTMI